MFLDRSTRDAQEDWESVARFLVATFRAQTARTSEDDRAKKLISELSTKSSEFAMMWADNEVQAIGEGVKRVRHPLVGLIAFEFSSFAVDGRPDLKLVIYNPAKSGDAEKMLQLCQVNKERLYESGLWP